MFSWVVLLRRASLGIFAGLLVLSAELVDARRLRGPAEEVAHAEPLQLDDVRGRRFRHGDYSLERLARFLVRARVLSRTIYRHDAGADLAPIDLALGWGPMSNPDVLEHYEIRQRHRFYFWTSDPREMPLSEALTSLRSANMHLVPATDDVRLTLESAEPGAIVSLEGWLIRAWGAQGGVWTSSTTRRDTGNHACELVYVEAAETRFP